MYVCLRLSIPMIAGLLDPANPDLAPAPLPRHTCTAAVPHELRPRRDDTCLVHDVGLHLLSGTALMFWETFPNTARLRYWRRRITISFTHTSFTEFLWAEHALLIASLWLKKSPFEILAELKNKNPCRPDFKKFYINFTEPLYSRNNDSLYVKTSPCPRPGCTRV